MRWRPRRARVLVQGLAPLPMPFVPPLVEPAGIFDQCIFGDQLKEARIVPCHSHLHHSTLPWYCSHHLHHINARSSRNGRARNVTAARASGTAERRHQAGHKRRPRGNNSKEVQKASPRKRRCAQEPARQQQQRAQHLRYESGAVHKDGAAQHFTHKCGTQRPRHDTRCGTRRLTQGRQQAR